MSLALVLALATIASLASDTIWYWIGRRRGGRVLGWLCQISLEPDSCVRRTQYAFSVHGARSLLIAKFVPGFSTAAPPLAGIIRMPFLRFVVVTGLGGLIWAGVFVGLGWLFSYQLELVAAYVVGLGTGAVLVLAAGLGAYIAWKYIARRQFLRQIRTAQITPKELKAKLDAGEDMMVVDVRHRVDFEAEPSIIPGALHLTTEDLEARHHEIPRERDIRTQAAVIATGVSYNRLDVDGVEGLVGQGVFYGAATAEAAALSGQEVFLVDGGNSAGQAAAHLARYAAEVTILVRGPSLSMSDYLVKQIGRTANMRVRFSTRILRAAGASRLEGLTVEEVVSGTTETLPASALFVLIGAGAHTGWLAGTVQRDDDGYVFTGSAVVRGDAGVPGWPLDRAPYLLETSLPGVFAAGDVRCRAPKGVAAAVGEGAIAIRSVREYLSEE